MVWSTHSSKMFLFQLALVALVSAAAIINVERDVEPAEADLAAITRDIFKIETDLAVFGSAPSIINVLVRAAGALNIPDTYFLPTRRSTRIYSS
jgi:hypothetical protein